MLQFVQQSRNVLDLLLLHDTAVAAAYKDIQCYFFYRMDVNDIFIEDTNSILNKIYTDNGTFAKNEQLMASLTKYGKTIAKYGHPIVSLPNMNIFTNMDYYGFTVTTTWSSDIFTKYKNIPMVSIWNMDSH